MKSLQTISGDKINYPNYFDTVIIKQKENAEKHNITYSYLDGLEEILKKELLKG